MTEQTPFFIPDEDSPEDKDLRDPFEGGDTDQVSFESE